MGRPYSQDLRQRIVGYVAAGHLARAAARIFGVSASTAVRLAADHRRRGSVAPKRQGRPPGATGKLAPHLGFLLEVVASDPDITLHELAGALGRRSGGPRSGVVDPPGPHQGRILI